MLSDGPAAVAAAWLPRRSRRALPGSSGIPRPAAVVVWALAHRVGTVLPTGRCGGDSARVPFVVPWRESSPGGPYGHTCEGLARLKLRASPLGGRPPGGCAGRRSPIGDVSEEHLPSLHGQTVQSKRTLGTGDVDHATCGREAEP